VHGHDERVLERRGDVDLAVESLDVDAADQLGGQDLDNDFASEPGIVGHENVAHTAAAELVLERVGVAEGGLEPCAE